MIKVMIVDDSTLMLKLISDIVQSDSEMEVLATAKNGIEALEKLNDCQPDVITMDIEMPKMDGLTTLQKIIEKGYNIPVLMLSALTTQGAAQTLKALEIGATDFITKPTNFFAMNQLEKKMEVLSKIRAIAESKMKFSKTLRMSVKPLIPSIKKTSFEFPLENLSVNYKGIVAIGASTGGPKALQSVIPYIPKNLDGTIVVVQHMPANFTRSLAERLNQISELTVKEAEDGDILRRGYVYIGPGDYHMRIVKESGKLVVRLSQEPKVMGLRPTVDLMMETIADVSHLKKMGIILTGMGNDGSKGAIAMKEKSAYIIAQDAETSVVYGMPKSAAETGCIDKILPLEMIAGEIVKYLEG